MLRKMNPDGLRVMFRTKNGQLITARLELEAGRAVAVLYEYGPKGTTEVIGKETIELDMRFLQRMDQKHGADYLYKGEIELPKPERN